ncbi:MAG: hypothetical protein KDJ36_01925 [Hyphomicrobiaceae bacterium]|nr:hypothetical protein [Hyphomicrobiaceae bacterium]
MASSSSTGAHFADDHDWIEPPPPRRDWKKATLVLGLGALSWVATYVGMLELIEANMGGLTLAHKAVIGFSVAMLMIMIIWLLDQLFAPLPFTTRVAYLLGYLFLTLISVGFGFGFYWKVLESRSEASRSAESAVSQVKNSLFAASARLDQLQMTLDSLTTISTEKAAIERDRGASCPNSRPGDGPRRKLRDADAARFAFASNFVKGRAAKVKTDMQALDGEMKKIASGDPSTIDPKTGTRNTFLKALTRRLELTATGFNAFRTDPQLRQIRGELAERSTQTTFPTGRGGATFSCPDPQLQSALRGVVRAIDQLPELGKPQIATVEGAQAVVEAFRRLTTTLFGVLSFKLPPSAEELRALQQKAVQSIDNAAARQAEIDLQSGGLSKRDYIPLGIALFVDLCLLLVSIGRPMNRLHNLVPKMREAERGPVYQILSRFDDIHRDAEVREKFEIFRHVVFDFNGDYYVAVPLDAPRNRNPEEAQKLQLEAHLLGNLFASFEKEKIFSRVYNPLLNRKMIERKLHRQGSKFANSSAFRIYRFRDGAWSDIILGAVMGAAKRASANRRRAALERGPSLDLPQGRDAENRPETTTTGTTSARLPGLGGQRLDADTRPPLEPDRDAAAAYVARAIDPELQAKYGPYAATVPDDLARHETDRERRRPDPARWPYRRPEAPPGEAEVELLPSGLAEDEPANNNTAPSRRQDDDFAVRVQRSAVGGYGSGQALPADTADNVIPLPAARPYSGPVSPVASYGNSGGLELGGPATAVRYAAATWATDPHVSANPNVVEGAPRMNVRITERTADFSVPVTEATLPGHLLSAMAASSRVERTITAESHETEPLTVTEAALPPLLLASPTAPAPVIEAAPAPEMREVAEDSIVAQEIAAALQAASEDDFDSIAQRFAPSSKPVE